MLPFLHADHCAYKGHNMVQQEVQESKDVCIPLKHTKQAFPISGFKVVLVSVALTLKNMTISN